MPILNVNILSSQHHYMFVIAHNTGGKCILVDLLLNL